MASHLDRGPSKAPPDCHPGAFKPHCIRIREKKDLPPPRNSLVSYKLPTIGVAPNRDSADDKHAAVRCSAGEAIESVHHAWRLGNALLLEIRRKSCLSGTTTTACSRRLRGRRYVRRHGLDQRLDRRGRQERRVRRRRRRRRERRLKSEQQLLHPKVLIETSLGEITSGWMPKRRPVRSTTFSATSTAVATIRRSSIRW